jgi:hypothetical protein
MHGWDNDWAGLFNAARSDEYRKLPTMNPMSIFFNIIVSFRASNDPAGETASFPLASSIVSTYP